METNFVFAYVYRVTIDHTGLSRDIGVGGVSQEQHKGREDARSHETAYPLPRKQVLTLAPCSWIRL
jgi:hypothetical protein